MKYSRKDMALHSKVQESDIFSINKKKKREYYQ